MFQHFPLLILAADTECQRGLNTARLTAAPAWNFFFWPDAYVRPLRPHLYLHLVSSLRSWGPKVAPLRAGRREAAIFACLLLLLLTDWRAICCQWTDGMHARAVVDEWLSDYSWPFAGWASWLVGRLDGYVSWLVGPRTRGHNFIPLFVHARAPLSCTYVKKLLREEDGLLKTRGKRVNHQRPPAPQSLHKLHRLKRLEPLRWVYVYL